MPTLRADLISHSQLTDGNASVLFDGTTDSITIPSTSAFAFGTGDWTVEMFVNFTSLSGQQTLVGDNYGNTAGWYFIFWLSCFAVLVCISTRRAKVSSDFSMTHALKALIAAPICR